MQRRHSRIKFFRGQSYAALLVWLMVSWGCQPKQEVPLSPGAAAFMREVQQALGMLAQELVGSVSRSDVAAINAKLKKIMPESLKLCRACPFMIGILDRKGNVLTIYPPKEGYSRHYSDYKLVAHSLEKGKTCQGRLFLADGSKLYAICAPLREAGDSVGVIVLTTTDDEVKQRWGISEQEFLALDFD